MKLPHRTAVAELIAALIKGNRTMRELCEWTDMTDETVNAWLKEFIASGLVYIADYRKNKTGIDSPIYGWVCDDEASVDAPGLATNPAAIRVREAYRRRKQEVAPVTPLPPEIAAWKPRINGSEDWAFFCSCCSKRSLQPGSGRIFTGLEWIRVCSGCKANQLEAA